MNSLKRRLALLATISLIAGSAGYMANRMQQDGVVIPAHSDNAKGALAALSQLSLPSSDGKLLSLSDWNGKIRVINYWATWCAPCREEMPAFSDLQRKYADRGVQFVGISIDSVDKVRQYAAGEKISYPLLIGDMTTMGIAVALGNQAQGLPFTLLINRQGELDSVKLGRFSTADLENRLQRLLQQ